MHRLLTFLRCMYVCARARVCAYVCALPFAIAWAQLSQVYKDLYKIYQEEGWDNFIKMLYDKLDVDGSWAEEEA